MASKADEIIRLRNEGMSYALKIAKEQGIPELERQVKMRGALQITPIVKEDELNKTINRISDTVYNNILTMVYAVLHDVFGYGSTRLHRFKECFDRKIFLVGELDPVARHYATFEDFAAEANRLYDLGIDLDVIRETQIDNDENDRKYVATDETVKFLRIKGYEDAAEKFLGYVYSPGTGKLRDKHGRLIAEARRESDRKNKYYTDDAYTENIEYWFNIFGLALSEAHNYSSKQISETWKAVDRINGQIVAGTETLDSIKGKLLENIGTMVEFTKGEDYYAEVDQESSQ